MGALRPSGFGMPWNAQFLQAVWFTTRPPSQTADHMFERMLGSRPTGYQSGQAMAPMMGLASAASGMDHGLNWSLSIQPGRIDLTASPDMQASTPGPGLTFPVIQDTDDKIDLLIEISSRMIDEFPFSRLAVLANFVSPVTSHDEANSVVADLLGLNFVQAGMSDLLVRLNKRKKFEHHSNVEYNRLLTWKVDAFQQVEVALGMGAMTPMGVSPAQTIMQVFAASFQIDLNTVPGGRVFTAAEASAMFGDMCVEARRLEADKRPASLSA